MENNEHFKDLFERLEGMEKSYKNNNGLWDNIDIDNIVKQEFEDVKNIDINDVNNLFIRCKISKEDAQKGIEQLVKYKRIDENGKKVDRKTHIKIPSGIKTGSKIICYSEGNYIKEKGRYSNLILNIVVK